MKRKIRLGFITIGILLFLSGLISSLELVRFNRATHRALARSHAGIEVGRQMLDIAQEQNTALLLSVTDTDRQSDYEIPIRQGVTAFKEILEQGEAAVSNSAELSPVRTAALAHQRVLRQLSDTTGIEWFADTYRNSYLTLTNSIKEFMVGVQENTIAYTTQLEMNAYRASMVGIIALGAGILLLAVFYFMLNTYFIGPVDRITTGMQRYIAARVPFRVEVKTKDEIQTLKESAEALIAANKKAETKNRTKL